MLIARIRKVHFRMSTNLDENEKSDKINRSDRIFVLVEKNYLSKVIGDPIFIKRNLPEKRYDTPGSFFADWGPPKYGLGKFQKTRGAKKKPPLRRLAYQGSGGTS